MRTAVVTLSVDEAHRLERSLPAALAQPDAEVLVVDNACTDGTAVLASEAGARLLSLPERLSYAAAMNAGLRAVGGADAVLLLNADCVLDAGFLAAAGPRLAEPGVGSVAPRLLRATGMEEADRLAVIDTAGMTIDRRRKNGLVGHGAPAGTYARAGEAFGPDGACALYHRAALETVAVDGEVLDESMALWASDADLAWRVRLAGWRCAYEPAATAWHVRFYSPSTRAALPADHRALQFRNRLLMVAKNATWADLRGDLHRVLGYEVLALGHALLRERALLPAYRDAAALLPATRRRRAAGAAARRVRPPFGLRPCG
ncbi:MAG TPA: glycosyltransferase family 2 protein [Solirubrobacteraceae bacterium]|nr:glycosyltransferase family 2 protein [Solirubrobacteraceae bacterium]